jgi:chemotaxis protein CheC
MSETNTLLEQGDLLRQVFSTATLEASTAMSRWTGGLISMELDEIVDVPLEEVSQYAQCGDELFTMIVLTLQGELGGTMVLTFDEANGKRLAAALLHREENPSHEWSDLEISALKETGNILACAYLNALTRTLGAELVPSPPYFVQDFGGSVLEQAVLSQASFSDSAALCRTVFRRQGQPLNWNVFFVPAPGLRQALSDSVTSHVESSL